MHYIAYICDRYGSFVCSPIASTVWNVLTLQNEGLELKKVVNMMWIKEALFPVGVCFITPNYLISRIKGPNTIPNNHHIIK